MILLDTNIVSTIMRPAPPETVIEWLNRQETVTLYLSTITVAEIGYGLWILPEGKRRQSLELGILDESLELRVLTARSDNHRPSDLDFTARDLDRLTRLLRTLHHEVRQFGVTEREQTVMDSTDHLHRFPRRPESFFGIVRSHRHSEALGRWPGGRVDTRKLVAVYDDNRHSARRRARKRSRV